MVNARVCHRPCDRIFAALVVGMGLVAPATAAPVRVADTLPPPPLVEFGRDPAAASPPALPSTPVRETVFQAPLPATGKTPKLNPSGFKRYRVYVNGASPYLLQQVRAVEPGAFIQRYGDRQVIQAGVFNDETGARQRVTTLAAQGIQAGITTDTLGKGPILEGSSQGYFVVVPGRREDLAQMKDQALRLGILRSAIRLRERPYGPHMAIGPFAELSQAEKTESFLRDRGGLDARVYFDQ